jgi:monoamine oxidase
LAERLDGLTVRQWLTSLKQSERVQRRLFDPLALGILNDQPDVAAATGFVQALREIFYRDVDSTRLGLSSVGLSDLYTGASARYIEARGGRVLLSRKASSLIEEGGGVAGAVFEDGERLLSRFVVSTLPPWDLKKIGLPAALSGPWRELNAAPIVSISLWLDRPVLDRTLLGLLGTDIQWVFNKSQILGENGPGQYLALVISGAHRVIGWNPKVLFALAQLDLTRCLPGFRKATILRWKVVKEPFATLSPVPGSELKRPLTGLGMPGFIWAGDWTRTGLPATIESAVVSGHAAAQVVLGEKENAQAG